MQVSPFEVVSLSAEFETIPIRRYEEALLRRIYERVPVKLDQVKTSLLLQVRFSRIQLQADLAADQVLVLEKVLNFLSACVDVMSSDAWLNALGAMDLSQMCVQAIDSPLKQIPHFDDELIKWSNVAGVESAYISWRITPAQKRDGEYTACVPIALKFALSRDVDGYEEDGGQRVIAPFYHSTHSKRWPIGGSRDATTFGDQTSDSDQESRVKLEFTPKGKHSLKLYVICDSYIGADHDIALDPINVAEGEESESDEDETDSEEDWSYYSAGRFVSDRKQPAQVRVPHHTINR
ncbi:hypothetical protein APHAL10511_008516 [Amanita phalloides]|nr:hypothetical protein APHAL10511_008516 [Amanita phalloides]